MRRVDRWLGDWAESVIVDTYRSEYGGINAVERILRDPGVATVLSQHKVLWWPHRKNHISAERHKALSWTYKAAHQLTPIEIIVLIIAYGYVKNDDGTRFTKHELAQNSSISVSRYHDIKKAARAKMQGILDSYEENPKLLDTV